MIFQPTYFSPIYQYKQLLKADKVIFEVFDNYQKQTFRTRLMMYHSNGILPLVIPIKHLKKERRKTRDTLIENNFNWQQNHFRSLKTAYQSSPFFEYYEDEIIPLYEKPQKYLLDFLLQTQELTFEMLQLDTKIKHTSSYKKEYPDNEDFRFFAKTKIMRNFATQRYKQVFESRHGFIANLSILDLIFNEGPNAVSFLKDSI